MPGTTAERRLASSRLILPAACREQLARWGEEGYPHEVCGLLVGTAAGEEVRVVEVHRARNRNTARARDRYDLDPADYLAIDRRARARGLDVVGVWHTHPDHPPRPSITDLEAAWEGYSYLILAVGGGAAGELRSWRLTSAAFAEERILEDDAGGAGDAQPAAIDPGEKRS
ncbi:MAG: M67 family peptidase [Acidobacteria bacterium]|nr:MAG: M67 family peptidase [Acidobacteriota bacterium]